MPEIRLPHNWSPRTYQKPLWDYLDKGGRRAVVCWPRRAGKDEVCLHHTACAAHERVGNYWHMLPEYAQARKAIWDAVNPHTGKKRIDEAFPEFLRAKPSGTNDQEMKIKFANGSTWQVVGSDNVNSLVGSAVAGMVFSEYALSNPSAWGYLSPILMENDGWALFISTPRGHNHFEAMIKTARREAALFAEIMADQNDDRDPLDHAWFAEVLTNHETKVFTPAQLEGELLRLQDLHGDDYGMALWAQEYMCSFDAAIPGSIWGDCVKKAEQEGRICLFEIDKRVLVDTGFDLGRTDDTSIWFRQFNGPGIDIIDHHASSLKDVDFYAHLLLDKLKEHGITYGTHWLPHDARPRTLAAGGGSILQQFQAWAKKHPELGRFAIIPRLDVQEGIQAARKTFPKCRFHARRCEKGLNSLRQYHRAWDDDKKKFSDAPEHDWCLHGETKVLTRYGTYPIMYLPNNGEVLTLCGWKTYRNPRITRRNAPLVEVGFSDGLTVKCTPDHLFLTDKGWRFAEHLEKGSLIQSSLTRSRSISMAAYTVYGRAISIFQGAARKFIEMFGRAHSALSLAGATFTTETMTLKTTYSPTSNACRQASTFPRTAPGMSGPSALLQESVRQNGIGPRKDASGTAGTCSALRHGRSGSALRSFASFVKRSIKALNERVGRIRSIAPKNAKWLRIERVTHVEERVDVWCITVPDVEHFSLSNGAIVHNSSHDADAWRYLSLSWKFKSPTQPEAGFAPLAGNPVGQTFGVLKQQHLKRMKRLRLAHA